MYLKKILKIVGVLIILIVIIAIGFYSNEETIRDEPTPNKLEEIKAKDEEPKVFVERGGNELQGRVYAIDTGETVKMMMGNDRDKLVIWCEEVVALDPIYLSYEIL